MSLIAIIIVFLISLHSVPGLDNPRTSGSAWWQHPGMGISYTIESRPGWAWNRNYKKYNRSLMDENGNLIFNGPYCKVDEFVKLSKEIGADYHMFYAKWHDGICFFETKLSDWKTPVDYMAGFSKLSKKENIPFMIYYSNIFDHNPQFDHIQPLKWSTISFIQNPEYLRYLEGQYRELIEQYDPDGLWLDWYWKTRTVNATVTTSIDFIRKNYPDVVLGFNNSSRYESAHGVLDYTTHEIHTLGKPEGNLEGMGKLAASLFYLVGGGDEGWVNANHFRRDFDHKWSAVTPAGKFWQDPNLRSDPYDLPRIVAMVMACGGRNTVQVNIKMDGYVFEDHVEQMRIVGQWYKSRKHLFNQAKALRYEGDTAPGICGLPPGYKTIASQLGDDVLIHIIKVEGSGIPSEILISEDEWSGVKGIYIEPKHQTLKITKQGGFLVVQFQKDQIDPVDTILRLDF